MSIPSLAVAALAAVGLCALSGCATTPKADVEKRAAEVQVYEMDQTYGNPHEIVRRVWVGSRQAAFSPPTHPTREAAIAALRTEAAELGADGLVNVYCLDQGSSTWWTKSSEPAILCYGVVVKLRRA